MPGIINAAARVTAAIARWIVMASLLGIVLCVLYGIVTRNMNTSVTFPEELSRYLQVWFVSVGTALAFHHASLPATELVREMLPAGGKRFLDFLNHCLMLAFVIGILYFGHPLLLHLARSGQKSPNMGMPMFFAYAGIFVGYVMFIVFILSALLDILRGRGKFAAREEGASA